MEELFKSSFLVLLIFPTYVFSLTSPTVCLEQGACYKGSWINTSVVKYASFQGIRYAQPPVGDLRFKSPQRYFAGEAIFDVSKESKIVCPQLGMVDGLLKGQEDCLFLNVFVPEAAINEPQNKLPVMVWIHGGGLRTGSNNFAEQGPEYFMDKGVVIVTINYRLGPLGFLSLGTDVVPGNAGLRDQSLALAWVHENIVSFGGDPNLVTIFGESAGSLSVALHLISPLSQGLFHRAILQSGTAIGSSWGPITKQHALQYSDELSTALGCSKNENTLSCLQNKDMTEIISLTELPNLIEGRLIWMAVSDIDFTSNPFLPGDAEDLMAKGHFNKEVDVIIGTNADEGILFFFNVLSDSSQWDFVRDNFDIYGPSSLFNIANVNDITDEDVINAHKFLEFYVGSVDNINSEHMQSMFDMLTDAGFQYGTHKMINYLIKHDVTVYQYMLTYEGEFSFTQLFGLNPAGVCHADDLIYLWDPVLQYGNEPILGPLTGNDVAIRDIMTSAWTNFAVYGDPTPPNSGFSWTPQVANSNYDYWNIFGPEPVMTTNQKLRERMKFWDQMFNKTNTDIQNQYPPLCHSDQDCSPDIIFEGFCCYGVCCSGDIEHNCCGAIAGPYCC